MIELINYINKSNLCHKEEPLKVVDIIKTQKELVRMGYPFLPSDFIEFLTYYNGIRASDCAILGIPPLQDSKLNIVEFNAQFNNSINMSILGYDDSVFLVYDNIEQKYKLIDKSNMVMIEEFLNDELVFALNSILHF